MCVFSSMSPLVYTFVCCMHCIYVLLSHVWPELSQIMFSLVRSSSAGFIFVHGRWLTSW